MLAKKMPQFQRAARMLRLTRRWNYAEAFVGLDVCWCIASGLISPGLEHLVGVFRVVTFNMHMMTDWFHSTLLEKRTKESSICARSRVVKRVVKPAGTMKVIAGICPSANDRTSTLRVFQAANQLPF